tara:strand:- start:452 stop:1219 length:768 start_codon:yes stop_codon:yes gene_type:complete
MKASVIIANYNNSKFIQDCINSIYSQTYKDIEIVFFDDNSNDDSIDVIDKFKNIKVIKNKIQTKYGSINQMNAFKKSVEISSGDIIFFLDSDDYFHKNKIERVINCFLRDKEKMIIYDYPIILKDENNFSQKKTFNFFNTYWGYIHPTSCISIRREFIEKVFNSIFQENFTDIWFDLRILIFSKYLHRYNVIDENLTYYRQTEGNVSSKFRKFSKKWWNRRSEAHDYFDEFKKKNNLNINKNLDFFITKIINKII